MSTLSRPCWEAARVFWAQLPWRSSLSEEVEDGLIFFDRVTKQRIDIEEG
jgi:hypothetical protein